MGKLNISQKSPGNGPFIDDATATELAKEWIMSNRNRRRNMAQEYDLMPLLSKVRGGEIKIGVVSDLQQKPKSIIPGLDMQGNLIFLRGYPNTKMFGPRDFYDTRKKKNQKESFERQNINEAVMYHTSPDPINIRSIGKNPMWFSHNITQAKGWHSITRENAGGAHTYKVDVNAKIAHYQDPKIKKLFADAGIDQVKYEMDLVANPNAREVMSHEGTKLLIKNGYGGYTHLDYDSTDFQKDHESTVVFRPDKSAKIIKRLMIESFVNEERQYQLRAANKDGKEDVSEWYDDEDSVYEMKKKIDELEKYESTKVIKRIKGMEEEEDEDETPTLESKVRGGPKGKGKPLGTQVHKDKKKERSKKAARGKVK